MKAFSVAKASNPKRLKKVVEQIKNHKISLLLLLMACAFYWSFGYDLERSDFFKLLSLSAALFLVSWKLFQLERTNHKYLFGLALLFRLIFLFAIPNLSQDFYRFIWDGKLLLEGINPYLNSPQQLMLSGNLPFSNASELISGMGELSAGNHTNYPPLNQLFFAFAALLGSTLSGAVIVMRLLIIGADIGIYYFGRKLLQQLNLPKNRIFWYLLNPFIIIELTGNLHFEGVMLFFLLASLYLLHQKKWIWSAVLFACSVSVKLIPLLFLLLFYRKLGVKKVFFYYTLVGLVTMIFFLPFLSEAFIVNFLSTIGLWFQKFEFNASIYYLIRWIGFKLSGFNIIGYAAPFMGLLVFLFVLWKSTFRRNKEIHGLLLSMLFGISFYFFMATTVHPWYLATPLLLSIFTRYKFALVWTFMVILSYFAYSNPVFEENLWLVALEYLVVFGTLIYELWKNGSFLGRTKVHSRKNSENLSASGVSNM